MKTKELIAKADIALADLFNGGLMQPEMADRFLRMMMEESPFLARIRTITMKRPQLIINKLDLATRALRPANQGEISSPNNADFKERALAREDRVKVTTSKISLNTFEVIAEVNIPFEVLEDNIEGGAIDNTQFENTIMEMLAQRIRIDLEDLCLNGDEVSADPYLALRDGALKRATSNVVNNANGPLDAVLVKTMLDAMPIRYQRLIPRLQLFASHPRVNDYMLRLATRMTGLGDDVLVNGSSKMTPFGVPLVPTPQMPNDQALLLDPQNFIMGIQRNVRIDYDTDIRERVLIIVVTMRFDINVEQEDQIVRATNIGNYAPSEETTIPRP